MLCKDFYEFAMAAPLDFSFGSLRASLHVGACLYRIGFEDAK